MKIPAFISSMILLIFSCAESFNYVDCSSFNKKIEKRTDIKTPKDLILLYYVDSDEIEVNHLKIDSKMLGNDCYVITLIDEDLKDDSVQGEKVVMKACVSQNHWVVKEIKTNFKCWEYRGHRNWGTAKCN